MAGLHRSQQRGQSIEFSQHREYVPGDDLRQIDWKVYARSDKFYLRQYEDETNLSCFMLLDQSSSMQYQGSDSAMNKSDYAKLVVASLSFLMILQQDQVGLVEFTKQIDAWLPASSAMHHFEDISKLLEESRPRNDSHTDVAAMLTQLIGRVSKPSLFVLMSDFLHEEKTDAAGQLKSLGEAMRLAKFAGHDLIVLQVLDGDELDFSFSDVTQFEGLESNEELQVDPSYIRRAYQEAITSHCQKIEACARRQDFDYYLMRTDEQLSATLPEILAKRFSNRPASRRGSV